MIQKSICFSFVALAGIALVFPGCDSTPNAIQYFTIDQLETQDKFRGYDIFEGPKIDGPYRVVSGVNNTLRREGMTLLWRELDFAGTRWVFKDPNAQGYSYRFLALSNQKGEQCAIMLKSNKQVPPLGSDEANAEKEAQSKLDGEKSEEERAND